MIHTWYAVNINTWQCYEAIEPITLKRFLQECNIGKNPTKCYIMGKSKHEVMERLEVTK